MLLQWIAVILICAVAVAYTVLKIYKFFKGKNNGCTGCAYSNKCTLKKLKNTSTTTKKQ